MIRLLELIILTLTILWFLGFFGHSILPRLPHKGNFLYILSGVIIVLIMVRFLS